MLGKTLGSRYHIIQHLGEGGFGRTFLAEDLQLPDRCQCVVKQLKPQSTQPEVLAVARELFDREAKVLHLLGKHDQIPRLLAHFEEEHEFYLVEEFVDGRDLGHLILPNHTFDPPFVTQLLIDILEILTFVHQQGVIHRDIKPSNLIKRNEDGKLVLIDFGAVKQLAAQTSFTPGKTTLTVAIGSPGYMPNEQLGGKPKFCSDLYAVGMIGIHCLTGIVPAKLRDDPETSEIIWRDLAKVPPNLADVLDQMVRYDFRQRYQTAEAALAALTALETLPNCSEPTLTYSPPAEAMATATLSPKAASGNVAPAWSEMVSVEATVSDSQLTTVKANAGLLMGIIRRPSNAVKIFKASLALLVLVVMTGIYGYKRWFADAQGKALFSSAKALRVKTDYPGCVQQAKTIPPNSKFYQRAQSLMDECHFAQAKLLAASGKFAQALAQVAQISPESPLKKDIAANLEQWGDRLLTQAETQYESGNLQAAQKLVSLLPAETTIGKTARTKLATWQQTWQKNDTQVKTAQQAMKEGKWQQALDAANQVSKTPFWQKKTADIIEKAQANLTASPAHVGQSIDQSAIAPPETASSSYTTPANYQAPTTSVPAYTPPAPVSQPAPPVPAYVEPPPPVDPEPVTPEPAPAPAPEPDPPLVCGGARC